MKRALVFDSGVGGLSVLDAIAASGQALELDYAADNAWLPYGLKSDAELRARVPALVVSTGFALGAGPCGSRMQYGFDDCARCRARGAQGSRCRRGAANQAGGGGKQDRRDWSAGDAGDCAARLHQ